MAMFQDARYAVRTMRRSPGFTSAAILALALGIGANTAIFTLVNSVLLRPLPYKEPGRMVFLTRTFRAGRGPTVSIPKYFAWKRNTADVLSNVAAFDFMGPGVSLSGDGQPEQIKSIHASAEYFNLFGVKPVLSLAGGVFGLILGYGGLRMLLAFMPSGIPPPLGNGRALRPRPERAGVHAARLVVYGYSVRARARVSRFASRPEFHAEGRLGPRKRRGETHARTRAAGHQ